MIYLTKDISDRYSKAKRIMYEDIDTRTKSLYVIPFDKLSPGYYLYKYQNTRVTLLNNCIYQIMEPKERE